MQHWSAVRKLWLTKIHFSSADKLLLLLHKRSAVYAINSACCIRRLFKQLFLKTWSFWPFFQTLKLWWVVVQIFSATTQLNGKWIGIRRFECISIHRENNLLQILTLKSATSCWHQISLSKCQCCMQIIYYIKESYLPLKLPIGWWPWLQDIILFIVNPQYCNSQGSYWLLNWGKYFILWVCGVDPAGHWG